MHMSPCHLTTLILFLLVLNINGGMRSSGSEVEHPEKQFKKWVDYVGSLKHSHFETAKNKVFPSFTLAVDKNPALGDFTSIQDAIDAVPFLNLVRVIIIVHAGIYTEKVTVPKSKSYITIEGAGADKTVVAWGDTAKTPGPDGHPLGTFASATFAVNAPYFIAKNMTFKNTTPVPALRETGVQAVAFRISADTATFVGCKFWGAQDTLYDHSGRHYYIDCYIEGSVDFIFGDGLSLFEGWHDWGDPSREMTVFYGQYKCTGPGASFVGRVSWSRQLTDEEAKPFISLNFIDGSEWISL